MSAQSFDVIILGTGPAGLQAAIHAIRKKVSVLVLGRHPKSSLYKAHIENFCCMGSTSGEEILSAGREQAAGFGAEFREEDVLEIQPASEGGYTLKTETGQELFCRALVLAMGISRNRLGVDGEKELLGKGLSFCVDCDGGFFKGEKVAVVGDESAAVAGALTMLFFASEVHLISRGLEVSPALAGELRESAIILHEGTWIKELKGRDKLEGVVLEDGSALEVAGIFVELGAKGAVELAGALGVELDPESFKYIVTNKMGETNLPGLFAAGDITGPPWQMAKAVGEGCVAGLQAAAWAKKAG